MVWGIVLCLLFTSKEEDLKYGGLTKAILLGMIVGMVAPCIIDSYLDINVKEEDRGVYWWDYIFALAGLYSALKNFQPVIYKNLFIICWKKLNPFRKK